MAAEMITGALVSTFVQMTIDNLASRFGDLFRGDKSKKKQITKLKVKLLALDVVADDAEQKQFTNPLVRKWLLEAKDVVFDAEDLVEEINHALSKSQVEAQSHSTYTKVWNFLISCFVSSFENELIESRMEKLIQNLEHLAIESHVLGLKKAHDVGVRSGWGTKLRSTYLPNESVIYGRYNDIKFVFNWLTSKTHKKLSILSIVGMGGVGKTAVAQHVFNDPRMDEAKFDVKAWVCVSDEFDVFKVSRAILEHVTGSTDKSRDTEMVHKSLKEKLTGKKYLLVLDDVWNENPSKWEEVQKALVFGAEGSRILVTTRSREVASIMRSEEHSLKQLRDYHSCELFAEHAFRDVDIQANPDCWEIGRKIVKKCKGLPLALKTMGSLLYNKSSVSEWESVLQSEIWELPEEHCGIIPALALSYIHLPSHLKVCFAYCALFPKDHEFKKEHLMHLWMTKNRLNCPQEEVCQQYFNELLSRSFFEQSSKKEEVFGMHDLLNDLAKYVGQGIHFRCEAGQTENIQKVTRHYSVEFGYNLDFDGFGTLCDIEKFRTFMPTHRSTDSTDNFWSWYINMPIHELLSKFKFLRILSLSHLALLTELPDSISNLEYLRSLDLSYTSIKILTEKTCLLSYLQILKLNYCRDLEELPTNLHLLTNLCRLEFKGTKVGKVPPHLEKLKNLKVVMNFNVGHGREFGIQQLGELNLDGGVSIGELQNVENSVDALEADLKNKTHLVELELEWTRNGNSIDSEKVEDVIEKLEPSKNLKVLSIYDYAGKQFPNWLLKNSLLNLESLELCRCAPCHRLPPLGLLPLLKNLKISSCFDIVSIDADFHGNNFSSFKSLQTLYFSDMRQWEKWDCQSVTNAFPRLQHLSISYCPKLKGYLPKQLVPLETLEIKYCQQLEASAPKALCLDLCNCGKLHLDWTTIKKLKMEETSSLEIVRSDTLKHLEIEHLEASIGDDTVSLWTFPLDFFPTLRILYLRRLGNLQMISHFGVHNYLHYLHISECPKLESFPGNIPFLKRLYIKDCPTLEAVLPSSNPFLNSALSTRWGLCGCPKLPNLREEALSQSISIFHVRGFPLVEEFSEEEGEEWEKGSSH